MNFACKRMELENIILRQVTQTQNHIHAMCSQISLYWSKKYKITRIQNSRSLTSQRAQSDMGGRRKQSQEWGRTEVLRDRRMIPNREHQEVGGGASL